MPSREPEAPENSSHQPRQVAKADSTTTTPPTAPATTPSLPRPRRRLRPTLQTRRRIENAIELMINALDELDQELGDDREPSLGAPEQMNQAGAWHQPGNLANSISGCRSAPVRCSATLLSAAETAAKKRMNTPRSHTATPSTTSRRSARSPAACLSFDGLCLIDGNLWGIADLELDPAEQEGRIEDLPHDEENFH